MDDILGSLRTTAQLYQFKKDLLALRDSYYHFDKSHSQVPTNEVIDKYPFLQERLVSSAKDIDNFLNEFETIAKNVSEIKVVSAVDLSRELVDLLYSNIANFYKKPFVLSINIDETIVGGLILYIDGKQFDHSLKSLITNYSH